MNWAIALLTAAVLIGCALAMGEGATACVDLDTRSAFVVDTSASMPSRQKVERAEDKAGVACQGGGGTH